MQVRIFAILMLLVGLTAVATAADKFNVQNKQDNAAVYYRKAYSLWKTGKRAEAIAQVRKGTTKSRYEPESDDIMGFARKEEKRLEGTLFGEMKIAKKLEKLLPNLMTARAIARYISGKKTEEDYWVVVRFGNHIGAEKWALEIQLVGMAIEMIGCQHLERFYSNQGRASDMRSIRKRISGLQARGKEIQKGIGKNKPSR